MSSKANYKIEFDGTDKTDSIRKRFVSLKIVDNPGHKSDKVELKISNKDRGFKLPRQEAEITVSMGRVGDQLFPQGVFTLDEVPFEGPARTLTLVGHAANMRRGLKEAKSRHFSNINAGDLVTRIAGEHGLRAVVSKELETYTWSHIDQNAESDMHLLTRLADDIDAIAKPTRRSLLFTRRGQQKSASGLDLPVIALSANDVSNWRGKLNERPVYNSVVAKYQDTQKAQLISIMAGSDAPTKELQQIYPNETEAREGAAAHLRRLSRISGEITINMLGRADIYSESPLDLSGFDPDIDKRWVIQNVTKTISKGFTMSFKAELPN